MHDPVNQNDRPLDSRQRVISAIKHQPTDRVPKGELLIEDEFVISVVKGRNPFRIEEIQRLNFADKLQLVTRLDLDIISLHPQYPEIITDLPSAPNIVWADLKEWVEQSGLFTFAVLDGVMGWGIRMFGYKDFLILPHKSSLIFEELKRRVITLNLNLAERLMAQGIDGLILADDLAHRQGLVFSPNITKDCFLSALIPQVEKITANNIPVFFHSDGNLNSIMKEIVEVGFQGLHCLDQNSGMDVVQLQRDFGQKLTLWGGVSVEDIIRSEDETYRLQLNKKLALLHSNRGYILGTDSGLFAGLNFDSLAKLYSLT